MDGNTTQLNGDAETSAQPLPDGQQEEQTNEPIPEGYCLPEEVLKFEATMIARALRQTNGDVPAAAQLLGLSRQTLAAKLKSRHKALLPLRTPIVSRKQSIITTRRE